MYIRYFVNNFAHIPQHQWIEHNLREQAVKNFEIIIIQLFTVVMACALSRTT